MSRYRKIEVRMWGDQKFRAFDDHTKLLWCYLLSGPETTQVPGVLTIGEAGLAEALGWELKPFRNRFATVSKAGLVLSDWSSRMVFLPNAVRYNPPANGNIVKGWADTIKELPESDLTPVIIARISAVLAEIDEESIPQTTYSKLFQNRLGNRLGNRFETVSKPTRIQDQDQEQEQDNTYVEFADEPDRVRRKSRKTKTAASEAVETVIAAYRAYHPRSRPGDREHRLVSARLAEGHDADRLIAAIHGCHITPHNQGHNDRGMKYLTLELIMRDSSHVERFAETWEHRNGNGHSLKGPEEEVIARASRLGVLLDTEQAACAIRLCPDISQIEKLCRQQYESGLVDGSALVATLERQYEISA